MGIFLAQWVGFSRVRDTLEPRFPSAVESGRWKTEGKRVEQTGLSHVFEEQRLQMGV